MAGVYSGDFRGHGRKSACSKRFGREAVKEADVLFIEGSLVSRSDEQTMTEEELEAKAVEEIKGKSGIVLVQQASQNIDRLVSFYKAALRSGRTFVVDVYTANVLRKLQQLGNNLPYPVASCNKSSKIS